VNLGNIAIIKGGRNWEVAGLEEENEKSTRNRVSFEKKKWRGSRKIIKGGEKEKEMMGF